MIMLESTRNQLINFNLALRFVISVILGGAPIIGVVTITYRLPTSVVPLELALIVNIINVVVAALLLAIFPKHQRIMIGISLMLYAYLGYVWLRVSGHLIGIFFFMTCAHVIYLLRARFTFHASKGLDESLLTQFKGDTIALLALTAYYLLFNGLFNLSTRQYPTMKYSVVLIGAGTILLWAFVLWTVDQRKTDRTAISQKSTWVVYGTTLVLIAVATPTIAGIITASAALAGIVLIIPASMMMPRIDISRRIDRWHAHVVKVMVNPGVPRAKTDYLFTQHDAQNATVGIVIFSVIFIAWVLFYRKRRTELSDVELSRKGSFKVANRERLHDESCLHFLETRNPVRNQVQAWLQQRRKTGHQIELWGTISRFATNDKGANDLMNIINEYDAVRYDPSDDDETNTT